MKGKNILIVLSILILAVMMQGCEHSMPYCAPRQIQANLLTKCPDLPEAVSVIGAGIQVEDEVRAKMSRECLLRHNALVDVISK